ncbi:hypothetical protein H257_11777 [Rhizophagus clarus]|uniref:Tc1-like transposase DDE domain-containing protein n=1 Tax=Rhizophagus clarus TaxID=94130 RepID=A0A8H3M174_9GLOM|nr:hypothetical protein H257_11777 [Rhizophagus clarus]
MANSSLKRDGAPLTDNEKLIIINVYNYFSGARSIGTDHQSLPLRKRVAEVLGIAESTVGKIITDWNKHDDGTFTPHEVLGRPKSQPDENISKLLRTKILNSNKTAEKLHGELVPNSVHIWDPTIKPPGNRGRKRNDAEEWSNIPNVVKGANITPNQIDYHGNFNVEIFENLFATLCETIYKKYGSVNIHMDGARYHKRQVESIPTSSTKKQEIIDWLIAHDIEFSDELRRPELLELVQMNKEKVPFACVKIAERYNHQIFYTPPYHCELQPIEGVWAVAKGEVASLGPHPNLLFIRNTLLNAFKKKIDSKVIIGLWKRALKYAKEYRETDEYAQLIEEDFDDYDDSDDDE